MFMFMFVYTVYSCTNVNVYVRFLIVLNLISRNESKTKQNDLFFQMQPMQQRRILKKVVTFSILAFKYTVCIHIYVLLEPPWLLIGWAHVVIKQRHDKLTFKPV